MRKQADLQAWEEREFLGQAGVWVIGSGGRPVGAEKMALGSEMLLLH